MARPQKDGLLYFSFDTDFFYADSRIKVLKARYGSDGLIFYIYLLMYTMDFHPSKDNLN